ncbi:hypothetical protein CWB41_10415 [Methylovirgula ligni]|uniref:Uncharacterized protein n=1 Tax=Methylovirgula ligni TaxID=569860 RepID=A0A3D9Z4Z6_9HYPH|nr:hypothetical protein [Methylovirgula ligni]QAY96093.1 hypothetical protein CWB41_10415 [Methylovirgula ligni]REF86229.1 hypothetical protein DES32_2277 [Methylovirgula ligni]
MTVSKKDQAAKSGSDAKKSAKSAADAALDEALEDSFPASDPPSLTQPETEIGSPHDHKPQPKKR